MFKSKCKKNKDIDYDKSFLITKLFADHNMLEAHQQRLIKVLNNPSEEILRKHMDAIVLKENAFNSIMEYLVSCFEFNFNNEEIDLFKIRFAQQFNQKIEDDVLANIASKLISKGLVFEALAKENNIILDDDETKLYLDNYYKATNNSINDFLNDPKKFEEIKTVILEEKITQWLLSKFKVEFNLEADKPTPKDNAIKSAAPTNNKNSKNETIKVIKNKTAKKENKEVKKNTTNKKVVSKKLTTKK